jgi:DNA-binding SARP family transcriptional activator
MAIITIAHIPAQIAYGISHGTLTPAASLQFGLETAIGEPTIFRLLGPIDAWRGNQQIELGGWRQRSVLAVLALRAGRTATVAELVDAVWVEQPPLTARQQVHSAISGLRRTLGGMILTGQTGYKLDVPTEHIDVFLFKKLFSRAQEAAADRKLDLAVDQLNEALALWNGQALAGLPGLRALAIGLEEQRLLALEERIATELRLGRHKGLVTELSALAVEYPARERLIGQLMVALYRCGRASEALDVHRRTREQLAAELGLDTGPGLRQLELAILRGELAADLTPTDPWRDSPDHARLAPLAELPTDIGAFVGRADCLTALTGMVTGGTSSPATLTAVITGPPGVGKTALAVHWAHRMAARFPDGQLYADLGGFGPPGSAMAPADVLASFLEVLGVPPHRMPSGLQSMTGLFRSLVAARRMIVVLDNAQDTYQVRLLLPGASVSLVIVTSRNQMSGLVAGGTARLLRLDALSPGEAGQLLTALLGRERTAAEQHAVNDIVRSCARLPLALVSVAARAAAHPAFPLAALAGELRARGDLLGALSRVDPATDVRAAFSWSYRLLSDEAARLFRLLGRHAGAEISVAAAAGLAGVTAGQAQALLAELDAANMVSEHSPGRFEQHELLRAYAAGLRDERDRE